MGKMGKMGRMGNMGKMMLCKQAKLAKLNMGENGVVEFEVVHHGRGLKRYDF